MVSLGLTCFAFSYCRKRSSYICSHAGPINANYDSGIRNISLCVCLKGNYIIDGSYFKVCYFHGSVCTETNVVHKFVFP